jgi:hypothetical protein
MALLYVGPFLVLTYVASVRSEFIQNCFNRMSSYLAPYDYCREAWEVTKEGEPFAYATGESPVKVSFWRYFFLPYLLAGLLVWVHWVAQPDLRLSVQSFPKRTINSLVWLGFAAALVGIVLPLYWLGTTTQNATDFDRTLRNQFTLWWYSGAVLAAPLVFNYLVGPVPSVVNIRKPKIALVALAVVPVVGLAVFVFRFILTGS